MKADSNNEHAMQAHCTHGQPRSFKGMQLQLAQPSSTPWGLLGASLAPPLLAGLQMMTMMTISVLP